MILSRVLVAAALLAVVSGSQAFGTASDDCDDSRDPHIRIIGCIEIIEEGGRSARSVAAAYNNRGVAYRNLQMLDEAIADFDRSIEMNPDYLGAYINRGYAYIDLPQYFRAFADFNHVIEVAPDAAIAYVARGYTEMRSGGSGADAIPDFDMAISLAPNYVSAYVHRADAYRNIGSYTQALLDYNRAITLDPRFNSIYFSRALTFCYLSRGDEAIADFETSWATLPSTIAHTQRLLITYGLLEGEVTGDLNAETRAAVDSWIEDLCRLR